MFGMNDMLADMLKKAIPPEVMEMLTPEKLKEIGDKANAFVTDIRINLEHIKEQNNQLQETLNAQLVILEEIKNVNGSDGNRNRAKRTKPDGGSDAGGSNG